MPGIRLQSIYVSDRDMDTLEKAGYTTDYICDELEEAARIRLLEMVSENEED